MNVSEGLQRVATVIRFAGWLLAAACVLAAIFGYDSGRDYLVRWVLTGFGVAFVAIAYVLAWIVDGFAEPKKTRADGS